MAHNNGMIPRFDKGRGKNAAGKGMSEAGTRFRGAVERVPIPPAGTAYDPSPPQAMDGPPDLDQINADMARLGGIGTLPL